MAASRNIPDLPRSVSEGMRDAYNELNAALAAQGLLPHHAATTAVADTGTADLAAVQVLANALRTAYEAHRVNTDAHAASDTANVIAAAAATNLATSITLLNELKADFNLHIARTAAHRNIIGAGVATQLLVTTTDAIDLATSQALAAALLLAYNRHAAAGAKLVAFTSS